MRKLFNALLAGAVLFAGACATHHAPLPPQAAPEVDSARLMRDLRVLASDSLRGRRTGTEGNAAARRYLLDQLRAAGVEPFPGGFEREFRFTGRDGVQRRGVNLVGVLRGAKTPDRYLVVSAHYDHVGVGRPVDGDSIYNGADDNASGSAALLELARYFAAHPPEHAIVFALFDAEEMGLRGARAFVSDAPVPLSAIALNVNMDMVGRNAKGELYAAGAHSYPFLRPVLERVAAAAPIILKLGHDSPDLGHDDWTNQSDQGAFHAAGVPFVYFGVEDHPDYHRPSDEVERIEPGFFTGAARTVLMAVRALDREVE